MTRHPALELTIASSSNIRRSLLAALVALTLALTFSGRADAQLNNVQWVPPGTADYNVGTNWSSNIVPGAFFSEIANINNGGTAFLATELSAVAGTAPGGIILGGGASDSGTLEIRSGGIMFVDNEPTANPTATLGTTVVGQSGQGTLRILRGGSLTSEGALSSGGSASSLIHLGETTGSGTAALTVNAASNLNRTTRITGPNVNFTTNSLSLGSQHNLIAQITGPMHSAINSSGSASLGGALTLEFNGVTPAPGNSWRLVEANNISGAFSSVNTSATLPAGFGFFVETVEMGNRDIAQVAVASRLQLSINRRTGATTINNLTTSEAFTIDGYLITSPGGALDPAGWTSLADGGAPGWSEANPSATHVGELNLSGTAMIAPNSNVSLGNLYGFEPTAFGEVREELAFEYHVPDAGAGRTFQGLIEYTGPHNNLVLFADPMTGNVVVQNQSTFSVDVDGYLITSESSSLDPMAWDSLTDAGAPGWTESNPAANHIGELNLTGVSTLGSGAAVSLGQLFDHDKTGVARDLAFEFHVAGPDGGTTMQGIVEYDVPDDIMPPPMGIDGDYNSNGQVEQGDLDLVLLHWGQNVSVLPPAWTHQRPTEGIIDQVELDGVLLNWGDIASPGLGAAAGVPEPASWLLAALACGALAVLRRRL